MKYWRGYLTAAIFTALTWVLLQMGHRYTQLVDAVYPYVTRTLQTILAEWSGGVEFCIWQIAVVVLLAILLVTVVLMIMLKWNPVRWFGWVLAGISAVVLLHTGIYGLNQYAGSLADDLRAEVKYYSMSEIVEAAEYYQEKANQLALEMPRDEQGKLQFSSIAEQADKAGEGFDYLVYERLFPVFAGSQVPVKQLAWPGLFTSLGVSGVSVSLTGEAAVNPEIPAISQPFTICYEMARRMCISADQDATLAAFLTSRYNSSPEFQYSAYFMAYSYTIDALSQMPNSAAKLKAQEIQKNINPVLQKDMEDYAAYFRDNTNVSRRNWLDKLKDLYHRAGGTREEYSAADLIVCWYVQEVILPTKIEEDTYFDPFNEDQVQLHPTESAG